MNSTTNTHNLDFFIVSSCILSSGAYISGILELTAITSFCFILSIVLVIGFFVLISGIRRISIQLFVTFCLIVLATLFTDVQLSFDYFKYAIITICILLIFVNINKFSVTVYSQRIIQVSTLMIILFTNLMYYVGGLRYKYFGSTQCVYLNFENPNTAAIWLMLFFALAFSCALIIKKKEWRLLYFVASLSLLPIIYATESRNCILSCALLVIMYFVLSFLKITKVPKWICLIFVLLPAFFFFFYLYVIIPYETRIVNLKLLSYLPHSGGKTITTRSKIWKSMLSDIPSCFILGNYGQYNMKNLHNSIMTIYSSYGFFVTFLFFKQIYKSLNSLNYLGQCCVIAILFTGCFEASIFMGISGAYLLLILICAVSSVYQLEGNNE